MLQLPWCDSGVACCYRRDVMVLCGKNGAWKSRTVASRDTVADKRVVAKSIWARILHVAESATATQHTRVWSHGRSSSRD